MLKQLFFYFLLVFSMSARSQEKSWKSFIRTEESTNNSYVIVELNLDELLAFRKQGILAVRRLDQNHYVFRNSSAFEDRKVWETNNDWKLNIQNDEIGNQHFLIKLNDENEHLFLNGVKIVSSSLSTNIYIVETDFETITALAKNENVIYISDELLLPTTEARTIDMNINPNRVNKMHHFFPEINGSTETVSIQENRFDQFDIDLIGRTVESGLESEILDNHADEMATIIAGAGNSFVTGEGVVKEATITSSNFFPALPNSDIDYQKLNINTQNHSYGTVLESFYGGQAESFDVSAINNPSLLHVFSIGNQGLVVDNQGAYAGVEGYANITGNFKMSKNTLSVGSVDTVGRAVSFVSRGPAYDGRVKPEVVAYSSVGSSSSAALVSGVSVLLQHQYRETFSEDMPSALVKALLINSADDVGSLGLDFITGYGSVNAYRSVRSLQNNQFFSGSVGQDDVDQIALTIPSNAVNLKVSIVWMDLAANPNDAIALVNDLDLRLIDGGLSTTLPWVLDHSPSKSSLSSIAIRSIDHLNNVEQVTIDNPDETYTIEVQGFAVDESQDYYIAYQYDLADSFEWDYPTGSDNMPYNGESGSYYRWNTTLTGIAQLAYSVDGGTNWIPLDDNVDVTDGYWRWSTVPHLSVAALAKMTIGSAEFVSEPFTISRPFKTKVGFNCADSLMLRWPPSPSAESYNVFHLGDRRLEKMITTVDTFLVINNKGKLSDRRFSIQPNVSSGKSLIGSPTFDYAQQGVECYVFSFFQQIVLDTGIYLNLTLGTTYGIEEVVFNRFDGRTHTEIGRIATPTDDFINVLDSSPHQGYNEHTVTIQFQNGEVIELSAGTIYYLTELPLLVFPNPILNTEELNIFTKDMNAIAPIFHLFDVKGAEVLQVDLLSPQESTPINNLQPGAYFYRLQDGANTYSGRLLVR
jgi:hypothetical protein